MNVLSLFSGYEGFGLGLHLAFGRENVRHVGYCEIDPYCQEIIKARIRDGYLDDAPIWADIRTADFSGLRGLVDLITAGFPCQPHSVAGSKRGEEDERNLWPETVAVIRQVGPRYALLENVPFLLSGRRRRPSYFGSILGDLAESGYDATWQCIPASAIGAPHQRDRLWIVAVHADASGRGDGFSPEFSDALQSYPHWNAAKGVQGWEEWQRWLRSTVPDGHWCDRETVLCGVADGSPEWVDRTSTLGNGIVPAVLAEFLRLIARKEVA